MTKKMRRPRLRLRGQYGRLLLSYTVILMIPLVILTFFYSSLFMKRFRQEIYNTVDSELRQVALQMDNEWETMEGIAEHLVISGTAAQAARASCPLELGPVIADLASLREANPFLQEIAVVMDQQPYVATSYTTAEKEYYFHRIVRFPGRGENPLRAAVASGQAGCHPCQPVINRAYSSDVQLTAVFSFPLYTHYQYAGAVLFFVSGDSIGALKSSLLDSYRTQLYIMDESGRTVAQFGPAPEARQQAGTDYIVRAFRSAENQWDYYAYLPDRQDTFAQVGAIQNEFVLAVLLTLCIACVAISALAWLRYLPIKRLLTKAEQVAPVPLPDDANELASISHSLDYLADQNASLSNRLSENLAAIKNERLFRLLSGKYTTREEFELDCSELDLSLKYRYAAVGILLFHDPVPDPGAAVETVRRAFAKEQVYYCVHALHPDRIILIVSLADREAPLGRRFEEARRKLVEKRRLSVTAGVGNIVDGTAAIARSYMEASSALDYRFIKGKETTICFQEVADLTRAEVHYPQEEFAALDHALLTRNSQQIRGATQTIIDFVEHTPMPLYLARDICLELLRLLGGYFRTGQSAATPLEVSGIETAHEIAAMLRRWCEQLKDPVPEERTVPVAEVLAYLEENVFRCDFSVYNTAEHFGMTLPAFSKYFKDAMEQNVMDYTIQMRMQRARQLLTETKLPLKDIAEQVGYYNVSSFTRRFRLNQGITPGEYRKLARPPQQGAKG